MVGAAIKTPTASTGAPPPKPRPVTPQREGSPRRAGRPGLVIRIALTVFVIWHFTGVFLAALSVPTSSELVLGIAQHWPMQWYLDALYMNQGHSFFAPDVGPGHLIKYQLLDQSGREIEKGDFPSRKDHWPRLLYHRYFMLADQAELPFDDKPTRDYWGRKYLEAYGRQLLAINENAQSVRLLRYNHWPPPRRYFVDKDGKPITNPKPSLTDPKGYELQLDVTQRRSDLAPPPPTNQSMYWQQGRAAETARRWPTGAPR
jgi:hypothetical protein